MQAHRFSVALAALIGTFACAGTSAAAQDLQLRAPAPGDIAPARLRVANLETADLDRKPVAVSWMLDGTQALDTHPRPFVRDSREYWIDANDVELQRGVDLALSAPGAVVRISPHGNPATKLAASDIRYSIDGKQLDNAQAVRSIANDDELHAAGMDVPQGSVAMRLSDALAGGKVRLTIPTASGPFLIHVYEPASKVVLHLGTERDGVDAGQPLRVRASLDGAPSMARIGGIASAPDGHSQDIDFVRQSDGTYTADFTPDPAHAIGPGLWEVQAFATAAGRNAIPRDAKTAFAVAAPVARLDGSASRIDVKGAAIALRIGVETVAASRYMASAVLYGTGADGTLRPAAVAQSAAWLGEGRASLELRFDASSLDAALHAPWELRDLRLVNQAGFGLLERRERALILP